MESTRSDQQVQRIQRRGDDIQKAHAGSAVGQLNVCYPRLGAWSIDDRSANLRRSYFACTHTVS
jgi:hypothetical protein